MFPASHRGCVSELTFIVAVFGFLCAGCKAQDVAPPIPKRMVLHSKVLAEDRVVFVRLPQSYTDTGKYPVLYLTEGDLYINEIGSVIDFLASNNRMPELIVVGIVSTDRNHDFTPTHADVKSPNGTIVFRMPTSGGADKFLSFIESELVPEIEERYRTEPFRIVVGHSLGGLFALHALITRPMLFNGYIAVSPSLEWDNEIILRRMEQVFVSEKKLKATLFFSLSDEGRNVKRFGDDFEDLKHILSTDTPDGLSWDSILMQDEDHSSGVLRAHYSGLRMIFSSWQLAREPKTQIPVGGLAGIERHYRELSHRFGFPVSAEQSIDELGYQLMPQNSKEALVVFKRNVELYPDSPNVYNSLADCYEAMGQLELAKQNVSKAIDLGAKENNPQLADFRDHLRRLMSGKHNE